MKPTERLRPITPRKGILAGYIVLAALFFSVGVVTVGVIGFFRLGSETTALRQSLMSAVRGNWNKKLALHAGWFTTAAVRAGSRWVKLAPEPRAALDALRGAEVGVYSLVQEAGRADLPKALSEADRAMARRGWERTVGVIQDRELVAVYLPRKLSSASRMKTCIMVFNGHDLVVVSVRGDAEPLLALATKRLDLQRRMGSLAMSYPRSP